MRATLIVPTLNESESIGQVLGTFRRAVDTANGSLAPPRTVDWELIVVDGGSSDGTARIAEAAGARVIVEPRRGYGRAYKTGFAAARGEVIATADGDGTYPVERIPSLVDRLVAERIDFLTGNRIATIDRRAMTTEHRIGNRVLNLTARVLYHHYLTEMPSGPLEDSQSGFWVFRREILDQVHIEQDGMAFSEELKIEATLRGLRVVEIPIAYRERWGRPKLSSWRDGWQNFVFLFKKRLAVKREGTHGRPAPFAHGPDAEPPR
ncbi:MAG: glycosyltransferase family 2 protein [Thermoplasmata archaeon]